jgi:hypothetical protein
MKNNIEISICPIIQQKEEKKDSSKEFIVKVDDFIGDYLESLLNVIDKYNNKGVNFNVANRIETGDYIIFTKKGVYVKEQVYENKILSLVCDYYKVVDKIKNLYSNQDCLPHKECKDCPYYKSGKKNIIKDILYDGEYISNKEKVSIFNNFVKIGYDTYNIRKNNKVEIDNNIYEVSIVDIFIKPKKESICSKVCKCLKKCA